MGETCQRLWDLLRHNETAESSMSSQANPMDSHSGRAVALLRELLLGGEFRPGERISELPLVERLGVSRTPIRLALEKLAQEGLLEKSPTGGFTVRAFTLSDIWDAI